MIDRTRYRYVDWTAGRILEAREMTTLESIVTGAGMANGTSAQDLDAIYNEGALLNAKVTINGMSVQLTPADVANPNILAFVRGRWETLKAVENPVNVLNSSHLSLYLFYYVVDVASGVSDTDTTDSQLVTTTGEATADMGELRLMVTSNPTFTPAVPCLEHYGPITLYTFTASAGTLTVASELPNAQTQALASAVNGGPVLLSTATAAGVACATNDPRLSDMRAPADGSVTDVKVRTPLPTGSGTYDLTQDPGGISADKIIHQETYARVGDELTSIMNKQTTDEAVVAAHIGTVLGLSDTHPMPNYKDVGATPASHQTLDLGHAHTPTVSTQGGGFELVRAGAYTGTSNPPVEQDAAYSVLQDGVVTAAILHDGDVFSEPAGVFNATPSFTGKASGPLNLMSLVSKVLSQHVNRGPDTNPHGLTCPDIGAATTAYVDAAEAAAVVLADNAVPAIVTSLFPVSVETPGYIKFPTNPQLILQWGQCQSMSSSKAATQAFPIRFPNNCFGVLLSNVWVGGHSSLPMILTGTVTQQQFQWNTGQGSEVGGTCQPYWFAIGY